MATAPTEADRVEVTRRFLAGLAGGVDLDELMADVGALHVRYSASWMGGATPLAIASARVAADQIPGTEITNRARLGALQLPVAPGGRPTFVIERSSALRIVVTSLTVDNSNR